MAERLNMTNCVGTTIYSVAVNMTEVSSISWTDWNETCLAVKTHQRPVEVPDLAYAGTEQHLAAYVRQQACLCNGGPPFLTAITGYVIHSLKIWNHSMVNNVETALVDKTVNPPVSPLSHITERLIQRHLPNSAQSPTST